MVNIARAFQPNKENIEVYNDDLNWSTVNLSDVIRKGKRLEASVFDIEAKHARDAIKNNKFGYRYLNIEEDFLECYTRPRFKRLWLKKSEYPIFQPSSILDIYPKPDGYISELTKTDIEKLRVHRGQILITCSGTIGNTSMVSRTLDNQIFSHDLLRVQFKEEVNNGFFYTFLKTEIGRAILNSNKYGSVISHIEASHMSELIVPDPPHNLKKKIHNLIVGSYQKRDMSNELINKATNLLIEELHLPWIDKLLEEAFSYSEQIDSFSVKLSNLSGRLEANYHNTLVRVIEEKLKGKSTLIPLSDDYWTKDIILAGVFKRNYVGKGHGYPFLGGKEITQLNPNVEKFLSKNTHKTRYEKELKVKENWILVTDRGSIGKTVIVPKHFEGVAVSQNVLKVVPNNLPGYIFCFLNSDYGQILINREIYGSVVNMIDDTSLGNVKIPMLKNRETMNEINSLVLQANELRYLAYQDEKKAINLMNHEVLGSQTK